MRVYRAATKDRSPALLARMIDTVDDVTVGICLGGATYPLPGAEPLTGSTAQRVEHLGAYLRPGVETLSMVVEPCTPASLDALAPVIAQLRDRPSIACGRRQYNDANSAICRPSEYPP